MYLKQVLVYNKQIQLLHMTHRSAREVFSGTKVLCDASMPFGYNFSIFSLILFMDSVVRGINFMGLFKFAWKAHSLQVSALKLSGSDWVEMLLKGFFFFFNRFVWDFMNRRGVHLFTHFILVYYRQIPSATVLSPPELKTQLPSVQPGLPPQRELCLLRSVAKQGLSRSLFVGSHEESPGMWDATSGIGLVSGVLFVGGFECVGVDKQGSALEEKYCRYGEGQWLLGLALSCFL